MQRAWWIGALGLLVFVTAYSLAARRLERAACAAVMAPAPQRGPVLPCSGPPLPVSLLECFGDILARGRSRDLHWERIAIAYPPGYRRSVRARASVTARARLWQLAGLLPSPGDRAEIRALDPDVPALRRELTFEPRLLPPPEPALPDRPLLEPALEGVRSALLRLAESRRSGPAVSAPVTLWIARACRVQRVVLIYALDGLDPLRLIELERGLEREHPALEPLALTLEQSDRRSTLWVEAQLAGRVSTR